MANILVLFEKLKAENIVFERVESPDGETIAVVDIDGKDIANRQDVQAIIAAHDPNEYSITPSKAVIIADGVDEAVFVITVSGPSPLVSINMLVSGVSKVVSLTNGVGVLPVSSLVAGVLVVRLKDVPEITAKVFAGAEL